MVTDAAGTGFEIKKPHKGTETFHPKSYMFHYKDLKLRNPIRGRKQGGTAVRRTVLEYLKLRNPIRGRKQVLTCR